MSGPSRSSDSVSPPPPPMLTALPSKPRPAPRRPRNESRLAWLAALVVFVLVVAVGALLFSPDRASVYTAAKDKVYRDAVKQYHDAQASYGEGSGVTVQSRKEILKWWPARRVRSESLGYSQYDEIPDGIDVIVIRAKWRQTVPLFDQTTIGVFDYYIDSRTNKVFSSEGASEN